MLTWVPATGVGQYVSREWSLWMEGISLGLRRHSGSTPECVLDGVPTRFWGAR